MIGVFLLFWCSLSLSVSDIRMDGWDEIGEDRIG